MLNSIVVRLTHTFLKRLLLSTIFISAIGFLWYGSDSVLGQQGPGGSDCIPFGNMSSDAVVRSNTNQSILSDALSALQATCTNGGFTTPDGQRIQIYRLGGCRYMTDDQKEKLRRDYADRLMQVGRSNRYETIVLDCNPRWGH